jgi:hypothetical protein
VLVKLTEVYGNSNAATNYLSNKKTYSLREIYVNPKHVVMIREENAIRRLNENQPISADLDSNHRFSKITVNRGAGNTDFVVVGAPEYIGQTLNKNQKELLRG